MIDKYKLLDSVLTELRLAVQNLHAGNALTFCGMMADAAQKLEALKKGLTDEDAAHKQTIALLEEQLKPHPDGDTIGGETIEYRIGGDGE